VVDVAFVEGAPDIPTMLTAPKMTKAEITARLGGRPPELWDFFGQCYTTHSGCERLCMLTNQMTRIAFTLKPTSGASGRITISPEAFQYLRRFNPGLVIKLRAGEQFLSLRNKLVAQHEIEARHRTRVRSVLSELGVLRKKARSRVSGIGIKRSELPGYLQTMKTILGRKEPQELSSNELLMWMEQQSTDLRAALSEGESPIGILSLTEELYQASAEAEHVQKRTSKNLAESAHKAKTVRAGLLELPEIDL
jgi:hypothetical protein